MTACATRCRADLVPKEAAGPGGRALAGPARPPTAGSSGLDRRDCPRGFWRGYRSGCKLACMGMSEVDRFSPRVQDPSTHCQGDARPDPTCIPTYLSKRPELCTPLESTGACRLRPRTPASFTTSRVPLLPSEHGLHIHGRVGRARRRKGDQRKDAFDPAAGMSRRTPACRRAPVVRRDVPRKLSRLMRRASHQRELLPGRLWTLPLPPLFGAHTWMAVCVRWAPVRRRSRPARSWHAGWGARGRGPHRSRPSREMPRAQGGCRAPSS